MGNHNSIYIDQCKKLIEEQLNWSFSSAEWKQRDYLNLIALIAAKTDVSLSLSTVKRIWNQNYKGTPHPSTLDTLAKFLDYKDWLSFCEHHKEQIQKPSEESNKNNYFSLKSLILFFGFSSIAFLILFLWMKRFENQVIHSEDYLINNFEDVEFTVRNAKSVGVPNTVIFNFDLSSVAADSFFIQQSWNPLNREKISKDDTVLTSIYYYPGVHTAKLIANDEIIKETTLKVFSHEWVTAIRYGLDDLIPTYIDLTEKEELSISKKQLLDHRLEINDKMMLSYVNVTDFQGVSGDHFTLSLRLKSDSLINITCPRIGILILGEHQAHNIPLIEKGCINQASVKFGDQEYEGRTSDLSNFGVNPYDWQDIEVRVEEKQSQIFRNGKLIFESSYTEGIGELIGFNIYFTGTGQIEYLNLKDNKTNTLVYSKVK